VTSRAVASAKNGVAVINKLGKKRRRRLAGLSVASFIGGVILTTVFIPFYWRGTRKTYANIFTLPDEPPEKNHLAVSQNDTLKVITLNIAHGRKDGLRLTMKPAHSKSNLDDIAAVLRRERPHMVALQEADGPTRLTGDFNHVKYLAEKGRFGWSVQGEHVRAKRMSYGTALLSMQPLGNPLSVTFKPSPPTLSKGFVLSTVCWPGDPKLEIDVVSVHLDFLRKSVRARQVKELLRHLSDRNKPLIVMGDFNCEWTSKEPTLKLLAEKLDLKVHRPASPGMVTHPTAKKRLDWILISPELEFKKYNVLHDVLSDHRGVVAEIALAG